LALPLLDLVLAWVRRASRGQHPFSADKQHLHHRLLERGHSHRGAVLLMYAWTAAVSFGLVAIALTHQLMVAGFVLVAVVLLVFVTRRRVRLRLPEAHG
jgi:UDP-GlcNAc:undecaprenyl-phosphate GlcNAc-1-phosphate transferase